MPRSTLLVLPLFLAACGSDEEVRATASARPVTVLELRAERPDAGRPVPGVVQPYRESNLAFEVGGTVVFVLDVGAEVRGAVVDEAGQLVRGGDGTPVQVGDVVARLDDTRYLQAVEELELRIAAADLGLEAKQINLDQVLQADLAAAASNVEATRLEVQNAEQEVAAAEALLELAVSTAERNRSLYESGQIPKANLDQSEADLITAQTRLAQASTGVEARRQGQIGAETAKAKAEGAILAAQGEIEATRADISTIEAQLERARTDLASCVLRAPFDGKLTSVELGQGSFVQPGTPVARLTLMSPILVEVSVSAEDNRRILRGSQVELTPRDLAGGVSLLGNVWEKDDIADPDTRTFRIGIICTNADTVAYQRAATGSDLATTELVFPVVRRDLEQEGPLYVHEDALIQEEGVTYVMRVVGSRTDGRTLADMTQVMRAEYVAVSVGDQTLRKLNWVLREVEVAGELQHGDLLVVDPRPEHRDGFVLDRKDRVLRPGDLVRVSFDLGTLPEGFYVPVTAVSSTNGRQSVFVVGADGRAAQVPVEVHETHADLRRVTGAGLEEGVRVVHKGAHFLADGEAVQVIGASL